MRSMNATPAPTPLVVLVHGAFHGAWCWAALQAELDGRGLPSLAIDRPGHGASTEARSDLHGDADALARLVGRLGRDVVLVGHSYGGGVITQADTAPYAKHLVYLSAMVPDVGESLAELSATLPPPTGPAARLFQRNADRTLRANPDLAVASFYHRCPPAAAQAAVARLDAQRAATLKQPASRAMWRSVPSTYIRCLDDQVVPLAAQDLLAARCRQVLSIDADHSPFLGRPAALADLLEPIVRGAVAG